MSIYYDGGVSGGGTSGTGTIGDGSVFIDYSSGGTTSSNTTTSYLSTSGMLSDISTINSRIAQFTSYLSMDSFKSSYDSISAQISSLSARRDYINAQYSSFLSSKNELTSEYNATVDLSIKSTLSGYSNSSFVDASNLNDLLNQRGSINKQIYNLETSMNLSSSYDAINYMDNRAQIDYLKNIRDSLSKEISSIETNYNRAKRLQNEVITDEFSWDFKWINPQPPRVLGLYNSIKTIDMVGSQEYTNEYINGMFGLFMAGGILYDSNRAGGVRFNVTGELNTTRFLGLKSKNETVINNWQKGNAGDLNREIFGNMAGDDFFSIAPISKVI